MKKFKVGDKVRALIDEKPCKKGLAYLVERVCGDGWVAVKDHLRSKKISGEKSPHWFEKVSSNKIKKKR